MTGNGENWTPEYEPWRHGGWYVGNVRYPSGAVGCVSRNYADRKWRIVCDERTDQTGLPIFTYPNRDAAARAERHLAAAELEARKSPPKARPSWWERAEALRGNVERLQADAPDAELAASLQDIADTLTAYLAGA